MVAEKYDIKEYTLRMKYWRRSEMKPSPFLKSKGITIGEIKFESNPFQISEAIILLINRLNIAEDKNRIMHEELDRLLTEYKIMEDKCRKLTGLKNKRPSKSGSIS